MREIKFRAWDKNEQLMYDAIVIQRNSFVGVPVVGGDGWELSKRKITDVELMQYTGLKDKNGKGIYEGDICKWPSGINREIVWDERNACFSSRDVMLMKEIGKIAILGHHLEIIGNKWENPELLTAHQS